MLVGINNLGIQSYRHFVKFCLRMEEDEENEGYDSHYLAAQFGHGQETSLLYGSSNWRASKSGSFYAMSMVWHRFLFEPMVLTPLVNPLPKTSDSFLYVPRPKSPSMKPFTLPSSSISTCASDVNASTAVTCALELKRALKAMHGTEASWKSPIQTKAALKIYLKSCHLFCVMPTGMGKTDVVLTCIIASEFKDASKATLYLLPTVALRLDMERRLSNARIRFQSLDSVTTDIHYSTQIMLCTYAMACTDSFSRLLSKNATKIDRIVFDEAHCLNEWNHFCLGFKDIQWKPLAFVPLIFLSATLSEYSIELLRRQFSIHAEVIKIPCRRKVLQHDF